MDGHRAPGAWPRARPAIGPWASPSGGRLLPAVHGFAARFIRSEELADALEGHNHAQNQEQHRKGQLEGVSKHKLSGEGNARCV